MWDDTDRQRHIALLEAVGMAEASGEAVDVAGLADELDASASMIESELEQLHTLGLCVTGMEDGPSPMLLRSGRQFLVRRGVVDSDVLRFLPRFIDDLDAREALLAAGTVLVDEFRSALLDGRGMEHARALVPAAFATAIDERLALDLYAAAVALMARLSDGAPAGCVAEEIAAVVLIEEARMWLEDRAASGRLDEKAAEAASDELPILFELFDGDDVLDLFVMEEPADAALAGHDPLNRRLGVVDQRIEAWFDAFNGTASTGYLADGGGPDG
jgi:hypothetical protein